MARVGGDVQLAGWRVSGGRAPSGWKWNGSQSGQGATDLGLPRPALWQMQGEAARRAGEPSGHREEAPPEGLGGYHLLAQTDARGPAGQVVGDYLARQPGAVGGEAARRHVVQLAAFLAGVSFVDGFFFGAGKRLTFLGLLSFFLSLGLSRIGVDAGLLHGSYSAPNLLGSGTVMAKVMPTARLGGTWHEFQPVPGYRPWLIPECSEMAPFTPMGGYAGLELRRYLSQGFP